MQQVTASAWRPDSLLTNQEAADWLRVEVRTLFNLRKRGEIQWRQIGRSVRFLFRDLLEFTQRKAMVAVER